MRKGQQHSFREARVCQALHNFSWSLLLPLSFASVCPKAILRSHATISVWTNAVSLNNIILNLNSVQASLVCPASPSWMGLAGSAENPPWQWCSSQPFWNHLTNTHKITSCLCKDSYAVSLDNSLLKRCRYSSCWCKYRATVLVQSLRIFADAAEVEFFPSLVWLHLNWSALSP